MDGWVQGSCNPARGRILCASPSDQVLKEKGEHTSESLGVGAEVTKQTAFCLCFRCKHCPTRTCSMAFASRVIHHTLRMERKEQRPGKWDGVKAEQILGMEGQCWEEARVPGDDQRR